MRQPPADPSARPPPTPPPPPTRAAPAPPARPAGALPPALPSRPASLVASALRACINVRVASGPRGRLMTPTLDYAARSSPGADMTAAGTTRDLSSLVGTVLDGTLPARPAHRRGRHGSGVPRPPRHHDAGRRDQGPAPGLQPRPRAGAPASTAEAQSAARLDHPNCIHVSAYGTTEDGMRYLGDAAARRASSWPTC